ncbi:MAG: hypothetical protein R3F60_04190 [bacterium]
MIYGGAATCISEIMCNLHVDLGMTASAALAEQPLLARLVADGLVQLDGPHLRVTPGRLFLRNVAMPFDTRLRRPGRAASAGSFSQTVSRSLTGAVGQALGRVPASQAVAAAARCAAGLRPPCRGP